MLVIIIDSEMKGWGGIYLNFGHLSTHSVGMQFVNANAIEIWHDFHGLWVCNYKLVIHSELMYGIFACDRFMHYSL